LELTNEQKYLQLKYKLDQSAPKLYNTNMYDMSGGERGLNIQSYKNKYVKTVKYNKKLKKFEPYDARTKTIFNEKEVLKYIGITNKNNQKKFNLETFETETPYEDLNYYKKLSELDKALEYRTLGTYQLRNKFSTKIEGTDKTLYDIEYDQKIRNLEAEVTTAKKGTSFEKLELEQLKKKSQKSVKPEVKKEKVKVETPTPEYKPSKTYEGTFIHGAFVGKETTPKKRELMINMP